MSEHTLISAVQSLIDRFPNKQIDPNDRAATKRYLRDYIADLEDLPEQLVVGAILQLRRTSTFMPSVAEIREVVVNAVMPAASAGEAWQLVLKQIGKHGVNGYDRVQFDNQAITDAVRSVGWKRICLDDNSKGYVRRDFETAYETAVSRLRRDVQSGLAALPMGGTIVALDRKAS